MSGIVRKTLGNGVRVLVEPVGYVRSAAIGLWCRTGSRHERADEGGITHLIEHMLFKGTDTRTAKEIAAAIEGRGGMLNAFTDKENTCYYCRVLSDDAANGIEVLTDMVRRSKIDPEELEREEGVVIEEIKRGEDEPGDQVHDLHLEGRWGDHPLGRPIIGTRESVAGFRRDHLMAYLDRRYRGENLLLSVAGNVDPEAIFALAEAALGDAASGVSDEPVSRPNGGGGLNEIEQDVEQVHFCIGGDGASVYDEDRHDLMVLDGVLGGGMASRLFQEIRERRGLAYSVGSYTLSYTAGGAFTVYGGTSAEKWPLVRELVEKEFSEMRSEGPTDEEIERVKRNLAGTLVLGLEGMNSRMMRMAKNELLHGREVPVEETLAKIEAVTPARVREIAARVLDPATISTTAIVPEAE